MTDYAFAYYPYQCEFAWITVPGILNYSTPVIEVEPEDDLKCLPHHVFWKDIALHQNVSENAKLFLEKVLNIKLDYEGIQLQHIAIEMWKQHLTVTQSRNVWNFIKQEANILATLSPTEAISLLRDQLQRVP